MKAIPFPQANKVLKAPPSRRAEIQALIDKLAAEGGDMTEAQARLDAMPPEQEVYDLPVWGGEVQGAERCISCWEPSPEERAAIAAGGPVWLWVVGSTHPPLVLDATNPFEPARPALDTFEDWWGANIVEVVAELQAQGTAVADVEEIAQVVYRQLLSLAAAERRWDEHRTAMRRTVEVGVPYRPGAEVDEP